MKRYQRMTALLMIVILLSVFTAGCSGREPSPDEGAQASSTAKTESSDAPADAPSSFDERCLDAQGFPTLYAMTELTGPEMVKLLEEQGYEWEAKDETLKRFLRKFKPEGETITQHCTFSASDGIYEKIWDREDYDKAADKGAVASMKTDHIVAGYADPAGKKDVDLEDVIKAIVNIEIIDQYFREDIDAAMVIAKDSSGKEYAVLLQATGRARTEMETFTEEVFAASTPPSTIAEQWTGFTGKETYGK